MFGLHVMAAWLDPALDQQQIEWARETAATVEPWPISGGYINYMHADEPIGCLLQALGGRHHARALAALKELADEAASRTRHLCSANQRQDRSTRTPLGMPRRLDSGLLARAEGRARSHPRPGDPG
jgi:hypothetical protein